MAFQGFSNENAPEAFGAMVRRQGASGGGGFRRPGGGYDGGGINPGGMYGDGGPIQGGPGSPPRPDTTGWMGPDPADGSRFRRPGGGYDGSGINPGGMYGGSPIQGGPFGPPQPGMGQKPGDITPPGPNHSREWFGGGGQELTKGGERSVGPHGIFGMPGMGGVLGPQQPPMDPKYPIGVGEGGMNPGPFTPLGQMDPKHPMGPDPYARFGPVQGPGLPIGTPVADPRYPRNQPGMTRQMWQQNRLGGGPQIPVENPIQPTDDWLGRSNGAPQGWNWSR